MKSVIETRRGRKRRFVEEANEDHLDAIQKPWDSPELTTVVEQPQASVSSQLDEKLEECLKDKASASYQNRPDFPEVIAFFEHFRTRFGLTPVSCAKLEQALEAEEKNLALHLAREENDTKGLSNLVLPQLVRTPLLQKLFREMLTAIGYKVESAGANSLTATTTNNHDQDQSFNSLLWKVLRTWRAAIMPTSTNKGAYVYYFMPQLSPELTAFIDERVDSELELCCWSAEMKLTLARSCVDALLVVSDTGNEEENPAELRIVPFAIDREWRKFWYFGDTYLFMEEKEAPSSADTTTAKVEGESVAALEDEEALPNKLARLTRRGRKKEQEALSKKEKTSAARAEAAAAADKERKEAEAEKREAESQLLTSSQLRIVCKTADDWTRLASIYEDRKEVEVATALKETAEEVRALEQKRLKEELLSAITLRTSTRVQEKQERRRREEELEKQRREEAARLEKEERRRMLRYASDSRAIVNAYEGVQTSTLDREERVRLREQKKAQQQLEAVQNGLKKEDTFNQPVGFTFPGAQSNGAATSSGGGRFIRLPPRPQHEQRYTWADYNSQRFWSDPVSNHPQYHPGSRPTPRDNTPRARLSEAEKRRLWRVVGLPPSSTAEVGAWNSAGTNQAQYNYHPYTTPYRVNNAGARTSSKHPIVVIVDAMDGEGGNKAFTPGPSTNYFSTVYPVTSPPLRQGSGYVHPSPVSPLPNGTTLLADARVVALDHDYYYRPIIPSVAINGQMEPVAAIL